MSAFEVLTGDFADLRQAAMSIRHEVFVVEQQVPVAIEIDGLDDDCFHVLVSDGAEAIATGRLAADGKVGRVAVRRPWRRKGAGRVVMAALEAEARRRGMPRVWCHAQQSAFDFYAMLGYCGRGEIFDEADIPHQMMEKQLD